MSVTYGRSVVFSRYSGFLHQQNGPPRYNWNIVERGVEQHQTNKQTNITILIQFERGKNLIPKKKHLLIVTRQFTLQNWINSCFSLNRILEWQIELTYLSSLSMIFLGSLYIAGFHICINEINITLHSNSLILLTV